MAHRISKRNVARWIVLGFALIFSGTGQGASERGGLTSIEQLMPTGDGEIDRTLLALMALPQPRIDAEEGPWKDAYKAAVSAFYDALKNANTDPNRRVILRQLVAKVIGSWMAPGKHPPGAKAEWFTGVTITNLDQFFAFIMIPNRLGSRFANILAAASSVGSFLHQDMPLVPRSPRAYFEVLRMPFEVLPLWVIVMSQLRGALDANYDAAGRTTYAAFIDIWEKDVGLRLMSVAAIEPRPEDSLANAALVFPLPCDDAGGKLPK